MVAIMKRALLAILLLPVLAAAQTPSDDIRAADAKRIAALVQGDVAALSPLLAEDLTYTHTNGLVENREQFLAAVSSGKIDYEVVEPSDVQVRVYGNTAVMTGRADMKIKAQGNPMAFGIRFTSVWVKGEGGWILAAWQSTRLP
jgi:ketosteroid isomerase-like protein